jgi:NADH dehydrogenase FAD-containing subunit
MNDTVNDASKETQEATEKLRLAVVGGGPGG